MTDLVKIERPGPEALTAAHILALLDRFRSAEELAKIRQYFKGEARNAFIGVRMGQVFEIAKAHIGLPLSEIEALLESDVHEARACAVSIMAKRAGDRKTDGAGRQALYDLYLRRHDRIDNWDLVDLGAWHVVGSWLRDRPRDILHTLAGSRNMWERRTAVLATMAFLKREDGRDDAYALAEALVDDPEDLIHKAVGGVLRTAGRHDRARLEAFLDRHAATMPRVMLRYAIEKFEPAARAYYLAIR